MEWQIKYKAKNFKWATEAGLATAANAVMDTAFEIETDAKLKAAVDTGFMRNSIFVEPDENPPENTIAATVGVAAEYGIHVDQGTVNQKAQPFFTPAVEKGRKSFKDKMSKAFKKKFK